MPAERDSQPHVFHVRSIERVKRVAKALSAALKDRRVGRPHLVSLEIVARMYGAPNLAALSAAIGRHPPSPDDDAADPGVVRARHARHLAVLVEEGVPPRVAHEVIDAVRPTDRARPKARSLPTARLSPPSDWIAPGWFWGKRVAARMWWDDAMLHLPDPAKRAVIEDHPAFAGLVAELGSEPTELASLFRLTDRGFTMEGLRFYAIDDLPFQADWLGDIVANDVRTAVADWVSARRGAQPDFSGADITLMDDIVLRASVFGDLDLFAPAIRPRTVNGKAELPTPAGVLARFEDVDAWLKRMIAADVTPGEFAAAATFAAGLGPAEAKGPLVEASSAGPTRVSISGGRGYDYYGVAELRAIEKAAGRLAELGIPRLFDEGLDGFDGIVFGERFVRGRDGTGTLLSHALAAADEAGLGWRDFARSMLAVAEKEVGISAPVRRAGRELRGGTADGMLMAAAVGYGLIPSRTASPEVFVALVNDVAALDGTGLPLASLPAYDWQRDLHPDAPKMAPEDAPSMAP